MFQNPYVLEKFAQEKIADAQRRADQARLTGTHRAHEPRPVARWLLAVIAVGLSGGFVSWLW